MTFQDEETRDRANGPGPEGAALAERVADLNTEPHPLQPDLAMAERFLQALEPTTTEFTFQTFDDSKEKRGDLTRIFHGTLKQHAPELIRLNRAGAGVFVGVNRTDLKGRKTENIIGIRAIWQEDDGGGKPLPLLPHIVVQSSPGKHHRYLLADGVSKAQHAALMDRMAVDFGSDKNAKDVARVLRLPGFYHRKHAPQMVLLKEVADRPPYSAADLEAAFPAAPPRAASESAAPHEDSRKSLQALDDLTSANSIHGPCLTLSTAWSALGMPSDMQVAILERLIESGPADEERKASRIADLPGLVHSAIAKVDFGKTTRASPLEVVNLGGLLTAEVPAQQYAVHRIIPAGVVTLLGGHGGAGKSLLALVIACHVALGQAWAGLQVMPGRVVVVSLEDAAAIVLHRLRRVAEAYWFDAGGIAANLQVVTCPGGDTALMREKVDYGQRNLIETTLLTEVEDLTAGAAMLVIDNASDAFEGNENERRQVRAFIRRLAKIGQDAGCAVLLLAHIDKQAARFGAAGNSYSGSTAWHNSARSRLALLQTDAGLQLVHEKCNYGPLADPIPLRWSAEGVLLPESASTAAAQSAQQTTADDAAVLSALRAAAAQSVDVPCADIGRHTAWTVLRGLPEMEGIGKPRLRDALARLATRGAIRRESYATSSRNVSSRWRVSP